MKYQEWCKKYSVDYKRPDLQEIRDVCNHPSSTIVTNGFLDEFKMCNHCYIVLEYGANEPKNIDENYK